MSADVNYIIRKPFSKIKAIVKAIYLELLDSSTLKIP